MKNYFFYIMLSLSLLADKTLASEQKLRTSYYQQNIAPQLFFDNNGQPSSGILFDITHAIADRLNLELEMLAIPRKRIESALLNNLIDLCCVANPKWYRANTLQWSGVIYQNATLLINNQGLKSLDDLKRVSELKIGTTLGYVYPALTPFFDNNHVLPIASLTPEGSYKKYRSQHISGFVGSAIEIDYFFKSNHDSTITLSEDNIHCAFSPSLASTRVKAINQVIEQLKSSGEITKILNRYKMTLTRLVNSIK
ncbi:amino acid ABC transporter substrate-binding protein, PAAT family [Colwellia chukchiensis]|uniref:Amino acid ABC transporter substrate-binding protein, PAAT family n=1 Tax=Colwellia chukchiensis TaxID=641665 RepID=A0A1H7S1L7_9GAMM|nr:transporter substrate-binding domain-containing protein [Colwellia chukchiensis]SEL65497.1 amino acid ABC transporter substrate-binding protein, PAAT family [Colwellia chukchiensis]